MTAWADAYVAAALGQGGAGGNEAVSYDSIGTDTRTLAAGSLFVALRGEHHDGHEFLAQAARAGARGAIVERIPDGAPAALRYWVVGDTLAALGRLARFHRRRSGARVCAITGSNGKTTSKELVRAVLGAKYRVHATPGNLNNLVGVPLTLLGAPADAQVIVAELGTNAPGEIGRLAGVVEPDVALITTVSAEHLEGLGDFDGVVREELAVLPWLPRHGTAVTGDEPPVLAERARELTHDVRVAGFSGRADPGLRGVALTLDEEGRVRFRWAERDVALRLRGRHNGRNALLALAMGRLWDVDDAEAVASLGRLEPPKMRAEFRSIGSLTVIADCYNANPGSVQAAIELLSDLPRAGGRVAVLGTMRELGPSSPQLHIEAARAITAAPLDLVVATGAFADAFRELEADRGELRVIIEDDPDAAFDRLAREMKGDEVVLLKASRGVRLERLLPRFEEQWGVLHPHGEAFGSRASDTFTGDRRKVDPAEHFPPHDNDTGAPRAVYGADARG